MFGLPELGLIELKYCDYKRNIYSPTRGLVKIVSCYILDGIFGCKKCSKVNSKRIKQYVKKHNLHMSVSENKISLWQRIPYTSDKVKIFC